MQPFTFNLATNSPKKLYMCQLTDENVLCQLICGKNEEVITMYTDNRIVSSLLRNKNLTQQ